MLFSSHRPVSAVLRILGVCLAMSLTAACSSFDSLGWLGEEETPLEGVRKSVMQSTDVLEVEGNASTEPLVVPPPVNNSNWSQPGGTPANAPVHLAANASLRTAWTTSGGEGSSSYGRLTSSPIVIAGTVFVLDAAAHVSAINARTGSRAWRISLSREGEEPEEGYGGGIAADFGRVIAATGFGDVFALDPSTGQIMWTRSLGLPIRAAPTASNGRVYVITVNNEIHCLDIETGEILWDFRRFSDSAGVLASTSPAVANDVVVVPYKSGELLAFKAADGKPVWGDSLTRTGRLSGVGAINDIAGRPVITDGRVFAVSHSGRLAAIDLKSGGRSWSKNVASTQTPWVAGSAVYVVAVDGRVTSLNAKDGGVRWVRQLPGYEDPEDREDRILYSGPVLAGGRLLVVSSTGALYEISPETGAVLNQSSFSERFYIAPVVASGTVYLLADDASLIALR